MKKKILSLLLALVMVLAVAAPVFAEGEESGTGSSLTIKGSSAGHTFDAYQILAGDVHTDTTSGKVITSNITWGSSIKNVESLVTAIATDEVSITQSGNNTTTLKALFHDALSVWADNADGGKSWSGYKSGNAAAEALASVLVTLDPTDSLVLDRLAELIGSVTYDSETEEYVHTYLSNNPAGSTSVYQNNGTYVISNLTPGYYLVKDRDGTQDWNSSESGSQEGTYYTKYIVNVLDETVEVSVKGSAPTVVKTVSTAIDGTYGETASFDIGDTAYYSWIGTLPTDYGTYAEYQYQFVDTLPSGLDFEEIQQIYVAQTGTVSTPVYWLYDTTEDHTKTGSYSKDHLGTSATEGVLYSYNEEKVTQTVDKEQNTVTVKFGDLKKLLPSLNSGYVIVVKYSATVQEDIDYSTYGNINPNTNAVYLLYSNNPNGAGMGKTVADEAYAFSYRFEISKHDASNKETKLADAKFVMYYLDNDGNKQYAIFENKENDSTETNDYVFQGYQADKNGSVPAGATIATDSNGHIGIYGVDVGLYYLEEIDAPDGYNQLKSPIKVEIQAKYFTRADGTVITMGNANESEKTQGTVSYVTIVQDAVPLESATIEIANGQGNVLPTTGGVGTTIFYAVGGLLVVAAVILLITKKRMTAKN